jgi:hypothetical protein
MDTAAFCRDKLERLSDFPVALGTSYKNPVLSQTTPAQDPRLGVNLNFVHRCVVRSIPEDSCQSFARSPRVENLRPEIKRNHIPIARI